MCAAAPRLQARLGYHRGEAADDRDGDVCGHRRLATALAAKLPLAGGCQHLPLMLTAELADDLGVGKHSFSCLSGRLVRPSPDRLARLGMRWAEAVLRLCARPAAAGRTTYTPENGCDRGEVSRLSSG
jgi:hypothetical protein